MPRVCRESSWFPLSYFLGIVVVGIVIMACKLFVLLLLSCSSPDPLFSSRSLEGCSWGEKLLAFFCHKVVIFPLCGLEAGVKALGFWHLLQEHADVRSAGQNGDENIVT